MSGHKLWENTDALSEKKELQSTQKSVADSFKVEWKSVIGTQSKTKQLTIGSHQHHLLPHQPEFSSLKNLWSNNMRKRQLNKIRNAAKRFEQKLPVLVIQARNLKHRGLTAIRKANIKVAPWSWLENLKLTSTK